MTMSISVAKIDPDLIQQANLGDANAQYNLGLVYSSGIKNVIANSGTALTDRQINLIWKFFPNPTICLDGDRSGQNAALRIAEKLFPFINDENKIFFFLF